MLIKPLNPRVLWTLAALGAVYLYVAFTVQFPAGYWDPFTPVPKTPVHQSSIPSLPNDPSPPIKQYAGWDYDPFKGQWGTSPATEDYEYALSESDKKLLDELYMYSGSTLSPKSSRVTQFYNLRTDWDWRNYINRLDEEGLAPLTKFAQRYIYNHQHPADCSNKKFIVFGKFPNDESFGLGAVIQSIATQLTLAIRTNRILIYDDTQPPGMHFLQKPDPHSTPGGCGQSLDCIFHPLTSCTPSDVARGTDTIRFPWNGNVPEIFYKTHPNSLPPVLGQALRRQLSDMTADAAKYWWRGQVAAYVMRPNGATMRRLKELRIDPEMHRGWHLAKGSPLAAGAELRMPFPIPEGAVSMHVRHGDKGIEMNLIPFQKYVLQAEEHILKNPQSARRVAFLSTEDPDVIAQAKNISSLLSLEPLSYKGWEWYWSDIPRFNGGPETQLQLFGNRTEMTIKWLLQLTMALECETFVGTRGSGWNRLIDQLRCTWYANCKSAYLEVGDDESWAHYGF